MSDYWDTYSPSAADIYAALADDATDIDQVEQQFNDLHGGPVSDYDGRLEETRAMVRANISKAAGYKDAGYDSEQGSERASGRVSNGEADYSFLGMIRSIFGM